MAVSENHIRGAMALKEIAKVLGTGNGEGMAMAKVLVGPLARVPEQNEEMAQLKWQAFSKLGVIAGTTKDKDAIVAAARAMTVLVYSGGKDTEIAFDYMVGLGREGRAAELRIFADIARHFPDISARLVAIAKSQGGPVALLYGVNAIDEETKRIDVTGNFKSHSRKAKGGQQYVPKVGAIAAAIIGTGAYTRSARAAEAVMDTLNRRSSASSERLEEIARYLCTKAEETHLEAQVVHDANRINLAMIGELKIMLRVEGQP